jgi:hypothetical protein
VLTAVGAFGQAAVPLSDTYKAITPDQRVDWFVHGTVGPPSLIGGVWSAGWGTLFNNPEEYGPHWDGFGKRYGMRLTGVATSNMMEASLGTLWGEDPRYFRAGPEDPFKKRTWNIVKRTFVAKNSLGEDVPAFARYFSVFGSNYLSNTWRADSEATTENAAIRVGYGFLGRMAGNAFAEFWPDVKRKVFKKK